MIGACLIIGQAKSDLESWHSAVDQTREPVDLNSNPLMFMSLSRNLRSSRNPKLHRSHSYSITAMQDQHNERHNTHSRRQDLASIQTYIKAPKEREEQHHVLFCIQQGPRRLPRTKRQAHLSCHRHGDCLRSSRGSREDYINTLGQWPLQRCLHPRSPKSPKQRSTSPHEGSIGHHVGYFDVQVEPNLPQSWPRKSTGT